MGLVRVIHGIKLLPIQVEPLIKRRDKQMKKKQHQMMNIDLRVDFS